MCQPLRHAWCGARGCTITRTLRPSRSVVPIWGSRRWRSRCVWTGRRCVPNGATRIRNSAPPAANAWCVPGSSRVEGPRRLSWRGSAQHEADTRPAAGRGLAGRGAPGVCPVVAGAHLRGGCGMLPRRRTPSPSPQTERRMGDTGWIPARSSGITSIACAGETSSARVGTRAVQQGVEADIWPSGVRCEGASLWRPDAA